MITNTLRVAVIAALLASASANATLEPRLGGQAYYDTETNLTWAITDNIERTIVDQLNFVSNLVIDGVSGWRIPSHHPEFFTFTFSHSGCPDTFPGCPPHLPLPPLDAHLPDYGWGQSWVSLGPNPYPWITHYDGAVMVDNIVYAAYRPAYIDWQPYPNLTTTASVWPVMTGDVALVPEPETYAMLLAGLGLLGVVRIKWKL